MVIVPEFRMQQNDDIPITYVKWGAKLCNLCLLLNTKDYQWPSPQLWADKSGRGTVGRLVRHSAEHGSISR